MKSEGIIREKKGLTGGIGVNIARAVLKEVKFQKVKQNKSKSMYENFSYDGNVKLRNFGDKVTACAILAFFRMSLALKQIYCIPNF